MAPVFVGQEDTLVFVGAHPVGDGLPGEFEGVFHAHRPQGGLLQKSHTLKTVQDFEGSDQWVLGFGAGLV
jgi:hypothetical protein